jgi:hypothetical protein
MRDALTYVLVMLSSGLGAADVLVGVIQESAPAGSATRAIGRVLFSSDGAGGWRAFAGVPPARVSWSVISDGASIASVVTQVRPGFMEADRGRHDPVTGWTVPWPGRAQDRFSGWIDDRPVHWPLVLSTGGAADPDGWRREPAPPVHVMARVFAALAERWGDARIDRLPEIHRARDGRRFISAPVSVEERQALTMMVMGRCMWQGADGTIRWMSADAILVDAGDWDGDGRSELLTWTAAYNEEGFDLWWDDARHHATVRWSHH